MHGFGERHLANLARLQAAGVLELVAVADPNPPQTARWATPWPSSTPWTSCWRRAPAPDVVILATPIQTHAPLALAALAAGADVYVEKPPVASMAQFQEVLAAAEARPAGLFRWASRAWARGPCPQSGRPSRSGGIGDVLGLSATGMWLRTKGYFKRSRWAGKRSLDGTDVVDGVATNALAHAVATGLHIAGAHTVADVAVRGDRPLPRQRHPER